MKKNKKYKNNNLKWDIGNRICIQFPEDISVDYCDFTEPCFKLDKKNKKIIIEIEYQELEKESTTKESLIEEIVSAGSVSTKNTIYFSREEINSIEECACKSSDSILKKMLKKILNNKEI